MPTPQASEKREDFISRCMEHADMQKYPQKQRLAIAFSKWRKHVKDKRARSAGKSLDTLDTALTLLETHRSGDGFEYSYKFAPQSYALDVVPGEVTIDREAMCVWLPFADGNRRDRVGDLLDIEGIRTDNHRANPVSYFNHGKVPGFAAPIGKCKSPSGEYTVTIDPVNKRAIAGVFFSQKNQPARQIFELMAEEIVGGGSIGYRPVRASIIPPDHRQNLPQGLHLHETDLLEVTVTGMPVNPDAVRSLLDRNRISGKAIVHELRQFLEPHAAKSKVWANGANLETTPKAAEHEGKAMSDVAKKPDEAAAAAAPAPKADDKPPTPAATPQKGEKYGAQCLRRIHEDIDALKADYSDMLDNLEEPGVKSHVKRIIDEVLEGVRTGNHEVFAAAYPDIPPLEGMADKSMTAAGAGSGAELVKPAEQKALTQAPGQKGMRSRGKDEGTITTDTSGSNGSTTPEVDTPTDFPPVSKAHVPDPSGSTGRQHTPNPAGQAADPNWAPRLHEPLKTTDYKSLDPTVVRDDIGGAASWLEEHAKEENVQGVASHRPGMKQHEHLAHHAAMLKELGVCKGYEKSLDEAPGQKSYKEEYVRGTDENRNSGQRAHKVPESHAQDEANQGERPTNPAPNLPHVSPGGHAPGSDQYAHRKSLDSHLSDGELGLLNDAHSFLSGHHKEPNLTHGQRAACQFHAMKMGDYCKAYDARRNDANQKSDEGGDDMGAEEEAKCIKMLEGMTHQMKDIESGIADESKRMKLLDYRAKQALGAFAS